MVEMKPASITTGSGSNTPVLILEEKESESKRVLLIWIGESEVMKNIRSGS